MKIEINGSILKKLVTDISPAIGEIRKSALPGSDYISIQAEDDAIALTACSGEIRVRASVGLDENAKIIEQGVAIAYAPQFANLARQLGYDNIKIEQTGSTDMISIIGGDIFNAEAPGKQYEYKIRSTEAAECYDLDIPDADVAAAARLYAGDLRHLLGSTIIAAADKRMGRPILESVRIEIESGKITAASTDTHQLSYITIDSDNIICNADRGHYAAVMPSELAAILLPVLRGNSYQEVDLKFTQKWATLYAPNIVVSVRLLGNDYPNWRAVVPPIDRPGIIVDTYMIQQALARLAIIADPAIKFIAADGTLTIEGEYEDGCVAKEAMPIEQTCEPINITLNNQLLKPIIGQIDSIKVVIGVGRDASTPITIRNLASPYDWTAVLMPIIR
jgi:DNA polymerase III sliding clamp (beta) subunit (PCNA family)